VCYLSHIILESSIILAPTFGCCFLHVLSYVMDKTLLRTDHKQIKLLFCLIHMVKIEQLQIFKKNSVVVCTSVLEAKL